MSRLSLSAPQRERFDRILEGIIERMPGEFRELFDEVPVIVEDEPSKQMLREMGLYANRELSDLCGIHWGIPLDERSVTESRLAPDKIMLFRGPIYRLAEDLEEELEEQIRITLLHELGHHFGLDEDELDEMGYG